MQYVKLPADVAQGLLNYLTTKPYAEVHEAVAVLRSLPINQDEEPKPASTPEPAAQSKTARKTP